MPSAPSRTGGILPLSGLLRAAFPGAAFPGAAFSGAAFSGAVHGTGASEPPESPLSDVLDPVRELLAWLLNMPVQATEWARRVDDLQFAQFVFFWVLAGLLLAAAGWFTIRYRRQRRRGQGLAEGPTPEVRAPLWLEVGFAAGLLAAFVAFWVVGFAQYVDANTAPEDAMEVYVTARQWVWKFAYADGPTSAGTLYVPEGRPVRLILTSRDVIHSFFVPAFRLKQDAVPGRYTSTWFVADRPGRYQLLCAEYCGAGHSRMWGQVVVLPTVDFADWLERQAPPAPQTRGPLRETPLTSPEGISGGAWEDLSSLARRGVDVAARHGCLNCHTLDGTPDVAPTWRGLFGSRVRLEDGSTVEADPAYLTRSMMDPMEQIVAGYPPVMPTFQGRLSPAETAALLELMKALGEPGEASRAGGAP